VDDYGHVKVRLCHIRCGSVTFVRLCGISAALRETRVLISSSEMSARSSITFTSIRMERLFAHIRSELKYLIGATIVGLKCRVFGGKTGPFPKVRVVHVVRPMATVRFWVEPFPEPIREIGPVANTS
jgi:hypothetical protein